MQTGKPFRQDFFLFSEDLGLANIVRVVKYINKSYYKSPAISISLNTDYENFTDLEIDDLIYDWSHKTKEVKHLQISFTKGAQMFSLVLQFTNDLVGPNGNYTIMLSEKEDVEDVEFYLWQDLSLEKYQLPNKVVGDSGQMIVTPIFKKREFKTKAKNCFILMPFTEVWSDRVWKHIKEIAKKDGYIVERADSLYGHNILEDIWTAINESSIIIADITSKNANVFYEIGISHTLGKKVVLLTQSVEDIPFDFKNYRHIVYEDNIDGFRYLEAELPKYL